MATTNDRLRAAVSWLAATLDEAEPPLVDLRPSGFLSLFTVS